MHTVQQTLISQSCIDCDHRSFVFGALQPAPPRTHAAASTALLMTTCQMVERPGTAGKHLFAHAGQCGERSCATVHQAGATHHGPQRTGHVLDRQASDGALNSARGHHTTASALCHLPGAGCALRQGVAFLQLQHKLSEMIVPVLPHEQINKIKQDPFMSGAMATSVPVRWPE